MNQCGISGFLFCLVTCNIINLISTALERRSRRRMTRTSTGVVWLCWSGGLYWFEKRRSKSNWITEDTSRVGSERIVAPLNHHTLVHRRDVTDDNLRFYGGFEFSNDGSLLVSFLGWKETLFLWPTAQLLEEHKYPQPTAIYTSRSDRKSNGEINCVAVKPNNEQVLVGNGTVLIHDTRT